LADDYIANLSPWAIRIKGLEIWSVVARSAAPRLFILSYAATTKSGGASLALLATALQIFSRLTAFSSAGYISADLE